MTEEEIIKKRIMDRLDALPKHKIYCLLCRKLCATVSSEREMVHWECYQQWLKRKKEIDHRV